jgi:hypothetical protein
MYMTFSVRHLMTSVHVYLSTTKRIIAPICPEDKLPSGKKRQRGM